MLMEGEKEKSRMPPHTQPLALFLPRLLNEMTNEVTFECNMFESFIIRLSLASMPNRCERQSHFLETN